MGWLYVGETDTDISSVWLDKNMDNLRDPCIFRVPNIIYSEGRINCFSSIAQRERYTYGF